MADGRYHPAKGASRPDALGAQRALMARYAAPVQAAEEVLWT